MPEHERKLPRNAKNLRSTAVINATKTGIQILIGCKQPQFRQLDRPVNLTADKNSPSLGSVWFNSHSH